MRSAWSFKDGKENPISNKTLIYHAVFVSPKLNGKDGRLIRSFLLITEFS
jgi:hypothetical protein